MKHEDAILKIVKEDLHPIDEIFKLNKLATEKLKTIHPSAQYDLKKYYSNLKILIKNKQLTYRVSLKNLEKGIKNGCYRNDINPELLSRIFSERIDLILMELFKSSNTSFTDVFKELINHYILEIVTPEGRSYYLNLKKLIV